MDNQDIVLTGDTYLDHSEIATFIVIDNVADAIFCMGQYTTFEGAVLRMMSLLWDFQKSYTDKGDMFNMSPLYRLEGEDGYGIQITYKSKSWTKECKGNYYILFCERKSYDE